MDKQTVLNDLESATAFLQTAVAGFTSQTLNAKPSEKAWSAAEILEHLWRVEKSINRTLQMPGQPAERPFDEKQMIIATLMDDDSKTYDSPANFIPSGAQHSPEEIMPKILQERKTLANIIQHFDLAHTSEDFRHPRLGRFTRYEWVKFVVHHANRHARQIEQIAKKHLVI